MKCTRLGLSFYMKLIQGVIRISSLRMKFDEYIFLDGTVTTLACAVQTLKSRVVMGHGAYLIFFCFELIIFKPDYNSGKLDESLSKLKILERKDNMKPRIPSSQLNNSGTITDPTYSGPVRYLYNLFRSCQVFNPINSCPVRYLIQPIPILSCI